MYVDATMLLRMIIQVISLLARLVSAEAHLVRHQAGSCKE
jgi:hypothetical protein